MKGQTAFMNLVKLVIELTRRDFFGVLRVILGKMEAAGCKNRFLQIYQIIYDDK